MIVASCPELQAGRDLSCQPGQNDRRQLEPLPADPVGRRLCEIFSYRWQAILAPLPDRADQKPAWYTETRYPLRPRILWQLWQDAQQLVGVRFGHETTYALIDIDRTSPYHPQQSPTAIPLIQQALETIGLCRSIVLQSSWSGGLHLYLPLPTAVPTFGLAIALRDCLAQRGFALRAGQLEVFPNVKRYGRVGEFVEYNAHRLPLQPGSGSIVLRANLQPSTSGLAEFFAQWEIAATGQDTHCLTTAIAIARQTFRPTTPRHPNRFTAWQQDLETDIQAGWTGPGQTNQLLKTIACHGVVFLGLSGDELVQYVQRTAVHAPGYTDWCQHQHEIQRRCTDWAIAAERHYWSPQRSSHHQVRATATDQPSANEQRAQAAQDRIQAAVQTLSHQAQLPDGVTARAKAIAQLARCSFSTLQKYRQLWHPDQAVIPESDSAPAQSTAAIADSSTSAQSRIHQGLQAFLYMKGFNLFDSAIGSSTLCTSVGGGEGGTWPKSDTISPSSATVTKPAARPLPTHISSLDNNPLDDHPQQPLPSPLNWPATSESAATFRKVDLSDLLAKIQVQQRRLGLDQTSLTLYQQKILGNKPYEYLTEPELEHFHTWLTQLADHPVLLENSPAAQPTQPNPKPTRQATSSLTELVSPLCR